MAGMSGSVSDFADSANFDLSIMGESPPGFLDSVDPPGPISPQVVFNEKLLCMPSGTRYELGEIVGRSAQATVRVAVEVFLLQSPHPLFLPHIYPSCTDCASLQNNAFRFRVRVRVRLPRNLSFSKHAQSQSHRHICILALFHCCLLLHIASNKTHYYLPLISLSLTHTLCLSLSLSLSLSLCLPACLPPLLILGRTCCEAESRREVACKMVRKMKLKRPEAVNQEVNSKYKLLYSY